jgi:hypothetical protein
MAALRAATLGNGHPWLDLGACAGAGCAYVVLGAACLRYFLDAARAKATLALAT